MGGYIKLWRKLLDSPIMRHDGMCRLWVYCLMQANWKETKYLSPGSTAQLELARGSFITTKTRLHADLYLVGKEEFNASHPDFNQHIPHEKTVWRWLSALQKMGCLTTKTVSHRFTIVTICNYEVYQNATNLESPAGVPLVSRWCPAEANATLYKNEELKEGKNAQPKNSSGEPGDDKDSDSSPAWLGRKWLMFRKGNQSRNELLAATSTFEEMIRLGVDPAKISHEIGNPLRKRTEPIWEFEKRLTQTGGVSGTQNRFDSLQQFAQGDIDA